MHAGACSPMAPVDGFTLLRADLQRERFTVVLGTGSGNLVASSADGFQGTVDVIEAWRFVEIRHDQRRHSTVHVLGWRRGTDQRWITPALQGYCAADRTVYSEAGEEYRLATCDGGPLSADLFDHLLQALDRWGFDLVPA